MDCSSPPAPPLDQRMSSATMGRLGRMDGKLNTGTSPNVGLNAYLPLPATPCRQSHSRTQPSADLSHGGARAGP